MTGNWSHGPRGYAAAALMVAAFAVVGGLARPIMAEADLIMTLLLAVVVVAYHAPLGPSLAAAVLSVAVFDFFFVPPVHTFAVRDVEYLVTFGVMAGVGVTISSLTARLRDRQRAANEARLQAEVEHARNALLSSVSHDLRTPLGAIMGSASALRQGSLPEEHRRELVDTICEEANYLSRLLENLLEMTRVLGRGLALRAEWQVPEEVVGAALQRLAPALAEREVDVTIGADVGLARFDGMLIELVLVNLLENATKYAPRGGISLRVTARDSALVWEVADEGPGLPCAEERLFEQFYRGSSDVQRGTGLGLAIAKAIISAHGGVIWGRNRNGGVGAVFGFTLPLDEAAPRVPEEATP